MQMIDTVTASRTAPESAATTKLRRSADKLVGTVFYGTLLRQMRSSSLKGKYGHGGRGEEIFQAQLDQLFAENAGQARTSSISDAIVREFQRQAEAMQRFNQDQNAGRQSGDSSSTATMQEALSW